MIKNTRVSHSKAGLPSQMHVAQIYIFDLQECGLWPMEEEVVEAALPPAQDDDVVNTWWVGHVGHIRTGDAKILSDTFKIHLHADRFSTCL